MNSLPSKIKLEKQLIADYKSPEGRKSLKEDDGWTDEQIDSEIEKMEANLQDMIEYQKQGGKSEM